MSNRKIDFHDVKRRDENHKVDWHCLWRPSIMVWVLNVVINFAVNLDTQLQKSS